jgi:Recombinase
MCTIGVFVRNRIGIGATAKALNERNVATPRGGEWTARSVLNVLART